MHETLKEIVGFFSRWLLLALAGAVAAIVAWAAAVGAWATGGMQQPTVILSDQVWEAWRPPHLVGRLDPPGLDLGAVELISLAPDRPPRVASTTDHLTFPGADSSDVGLHPVHVKGLPYGRLAFAEDRARCLVVPPDRRVFAVDARLAESLGEQADELINRLATLGEVVLVQPTAADTQPAEHLARRQRLMMRFPQTLLVYQVRPWEKPAAVFSRMAYKLHRSDTANLELITADGELATSAGKRPVHFLAGDETPAPPGTRRYATMAALLEALTPSQQDQSVETP